MLNGVQDKAGSAFTVNTAEDNVEAAVRSANSSDVAVVVVGNDPMCGATSPAGAFSPDVSTKPRGDPGKGREGRDRESLELPPPQQDRIRQVFAANPKTVVVLIASFPFAINWEQQNVPAILHITHAAQEQGWRSPTCCSAITIPRARLVQTWPRSLDQLPDMADYNIRHGRSYMYFKGESLYPFGYGLSYTSFQYSNVRLSSAKLASNGTVTVTVDVRNTGKRAGDDVVQIYVQHLQSKVERPLKELKGFQRVTPKPNESKTVQIAISAASLAYWNEQKHGWEVKRPVKIMVGRSSADLILDKTVTVE